MNPQKLAGQCGKLKCCLNFETDAYAEASRQLPPRDAVLLTQDSEYYQFKTDILARTVTYSTDKHLAANLVTISAARALEIIKINKQGGKVEQLEADKQPAEPPKEYVELVGQDSLTRFDKSGKNRKRRKQKATTEARPAAKAADQKAKSKAGAQKAPQPKRPTAKEPLPQQPKKEKQPQQQKRPGAQPPKNQQPQPQKNQQPQQQKGGGNDNASRQRPKRQNQNQRKNSAPNTEHQKNES